MYPQTNYFSKIYPPKFSSMVPSSLVYNIILLPYPKDSNSPSNTPSGHNYSPQWGCTLYWNKYLQHKHRTYYPTNATTSSPIVTRQARTGKRMWASPSPLIHLIAFIGHLLSARVLALGFIVTTCIRQCKCTCLQGAPLSEVEPSSFVLWHRKNCTAIALLNIRKFPNYLRAPPKAGVFFFLDALST